MQTLPDRIRRARALSNISQQALAEAVGVQRSAVAQWERKDGNTPSMPHLVAIAVATGVCLEWLGTGRGPTRPETDSWIPTARKEDFVLDDLEATCLASLRRMPHKIRESVVAVVELVARNY